MTFENNFNLLRLLAAMQVLIVHQFNSFDVKHDLFSIISLFPGVPIFFFVSGYLVAQSYERSVKGSGIVDYVIKRSLRIFPALWVSIFFALALAFAVGYLTVDVFLTSEFWLWIFAQASVLQFYNPEFFRGYGVGVINGALWTISVELQLYFLMPFLAFLIKKMRFLVFFVMITSVVLHVLSQQFLPQDNIFTKLLQVSALPWLYMFISGSLCHYYLDLKKKILNLPALPTFIIFILAMFWIGSVEINASNAINPVAAIFLMILVFKFANSRLVHQTLNLKFIKTHDLSYGIYIFHMPIINALLFCDVAFHLAFAILMLAVISTSAASWFLIEKPCLNQKTSLSNWMAGK